MSSSLQSAYDEMYTEEIAEWRWIGAKQKAENILFAAAGRDFSSVLECGAGDGAILARIEATRRFRELYAIEISDSGIAQIESRRLSTLREVKKFDGYRIPYADLQFDLAYCSHVLEHVEHPRLLLRELKRVSRHQVFEIPLDYSPALDRAVDHYLSYGHINIFTPSLFKFLLRSEGFEVLSERRTLISQDVLRFSRYQRQKLEPTLWRDWSLRLRPVWNHVRGAIRGKWWQNEHGYDAYTCLTRPSTEPRVRVAGC